MSLQYPADVDFPAVTIIPAVVGCDAMQINQGATVRDGSLIGVVPTIGGDNAIRLVDLAPQELEAALSKLKFVKSAELFMMTGLRRAFANPIGVYHLANHKQADDTITGE